MTMTRVYSILIVALLLASLSSLTTVNGQGAGAPINAGPATLTVLSAGTCTATSCLSINLGGYTAVAVQVTGTCGTCTLLFESTVDGTNWVSQAMVPVSSVGSVTSTAAVGIWSGRVVGRAFRARLSAIASGSFVVTIRASPGGAAQAAGPITAYADTSSTGSTGGGAEVDVSTYTMPANTLSADGQALNFMACARHAANTNSTTMRIYIDGVTQSTLTGTTSNALVCADLWLVRTSSTTFGIRGLTQNGGLLQVRTTQTGKNFAAAMVFKYSVQAATTTNDLIGNFMRVTWWP